MIKPEIEGEAHIQRDLTRDSMLDKDDVGSSNVAE